MQNILDGLKKISSDQKNKLEENIFKLIQDSIPDFNKNNIEDLSILFDKDYIAGDILYRFEPDKCTYTYIAGDMYTVNNSGEAVFFDRALSKIYDPAKDSFIVCRHSGKITFDIPYEQERSLPELNIKETDIQTINKFIMSAILQKSPDITCDEINASSINTLYRLIECHDLVVEKVLMNPFDFIDIKNRLPDLIDYVWSGKINTTILMPVGKVAIFSVTDSSGVITVDNNTKTIKAIMVNGQCFAMLAQKDCKSGVWWSFKNV